MNQKSKDDASFAEWMTDVKRFENDRINVYPDRVKNITLPKRQTLGSDPSFDFSTISYQDLSATNDSFFHSGIQKKQQRKIRQGLITVDDHLDLHGYNQPQAISALMAFIDHALSSGFRFLVVVHGKGSRSDKEAVLKPLVQHWLSQQSMILAWCLAQPKHGGSGASYVYLRNAVSQ